MLKFISAIQPRYVILAALIAAVAMFSTAVIELNESRKELLHLLQEHALSLSETIENSSRNIVLSSDQIEEEIGRRLLDNARAVARLDSLGILTERDLRSIAAVNRLHRINLIASNGRRILSSHQQEREHSGMEPRHMPADFLQPILSGRREEMVIGLKEARFEQGERYAAAVKRSAPRAGAVVVNIDAAELIAFRQRIGIGKLIRDLGDDDGIEYVVLQDEEGILAASHDVTEMPSIGGDAELESLAERDTVVLREVPFGSRKVFEVVRPLTIDRATIGVLRIGLSMDELRKVDQRLQRRLGLMIVMLTGLSIVVAAFVLAARRYDVVSKALEDQRRLTERILAQMHDAVVTVDAAQRISIMNTRAEVWFGVASGTMIGAPVSALAPHWSAWLSDLLSDDRTECELPAPDANGETGTRRAAVTRSVTTRPDGTVESVTLVIKDMTETRRLEQEMQRKDKLTAMGELASGVAHEIRNPLNAVSMILQRFEKEFQPRKGAQEYRQLTGVLRSETQRINGIIQQFLKFARPKPVERFDTGMKDFIGHVVAIVRSQAAAKRITLTVEPADAVCSIDEAQLTQALLNLLQNALEAVPEGGHVAVRTFLHDRSYAIEIADDGPGIPDTVKRKIFNLYYTTKPNGTGMGLAISQQIISLHDGRLTVADRPGGGTVFLVVLPLA